MPRGSGSQSNSAGVEYFGVQVARKPTATQSGRGGSAKERDRVRSSAPEVVEEVTSGRRRCSDKTRPHPMLRCWLTRGARLLVKPGKGPPVENPTDSSVENEDKLRMELARVSFGEVLDATKHQDDKIGRFLTAIAFLTTGAIALLFRTDVISSRYSFGDGSRWPLVLVGSIGFFACTFTAVMFLLISLSSPLRLPGAQSGRLESDRINESLLFFQFIADRPRRTFEQYWKQRSAETLRKTMIDQLIAEAHNLAERANLKYRHTTEASAVFQLGLLFLTAGLVLAGVATLDPTSPATAPVVNFGMGLRIGFVALLAGHAAVQLYGTLRSDEQSITMLILAVGPQPHQEAQNRYAAVRSTVPLIGCCFLYIALVMAPPVGVSVDWVVGGAAAAMPFVAVKVTAVRWRGLGRLRRRVTLARNAGVAVLPALAAIGSTIVPGASELATAALVPIAISVYSALNPTIRRRTTVRKARQGRLAAETPAEAPDSSP